LKVHCFELAWNLCWGNHHFLQGLDQSAAGKITVGTIGWVKHDFVIVFASQTPVLLERYVMDVLYNQLIDPQTNKL